MSSLKELASRAHHAAVELQLDHKAGMTPSDQGLASRAICYLTAARNIISALDAKLNPPKGA